MLKVTMLYSSPVYATYLKGLQASVLSKSLFVDINFVHGWYALEKNFVLHNYVYTLLYRHIHTQTQL